MPESKKKQTASERSNKTAKATDEATAPTRSKATKAAKPKPEKVAKEPLVVFAIRLTEAERKAIHDAAGPRNATQFVRSVALAAAREDESAFRGVLKAARELR